MESWSTEARSVDWTAKFWKEARLDKTPEWSVVELKDRRPEMTRHLRWSVVELKDRRPEW